LAVAASWWICSSVTVVLMLLPRFVVDDDHRSHE